MIYFKEKVQFVKKKFLNSASQILPSGASLQDRQPCWLTDRRDCIKCPLTNLVGVIVDTAETGSAIVRRLVPLFAT